MLNYGNELIYIIGVIVMSIAVVVYLLLSDRGSSSDSSYYDKDGNHSYYDRRLIRMSNRNKNK